MQSKRIISFLRELSENNNREWFYENKPEYLACRKSFEGY